MRCHLTPDLFHRLDVHVSDLSIKDSPQNDIPRIQIAAYTTNIGSDIPKKGTLS